MSENHLTEVLDSTRNRVYSPSTLHRAGRQAHDARGAPERWRRRPGGRGWAAEPRPPGRRLSKKRRAKIIKAPEPQRGPFLYGGTTWFPHMPPPFRRRAEVARATWRPVGSRAGGFGVCEPDGRLSRPPAGDFVF